MALSGQSIFRYRGHPTAGGQRDFPGTNYKSGTVQVSGNLAVAPMGLETTKDGKPGRPRYVYPLPRDYHADPANLGTTPNGPKQPGIVYWGEIPRREPVHVTREKLRRSLVEQGQSGSL